MLKEMEDCSEEGPSMPPDPLDISSLPDPVAESSSSSVDPLFTTVKSSMTGPFRNSEAVPQTHAIPPKTGPSIRPETLAMMTGPMVVSSYVEIDPSKSGDQ